MEMAVWEDGGVGEETIANPMIFYLPIPHSLCLQIMCESTTWRARSPLMFGVTPCAPTPLLSPTRAVRKRGSGGVEVGLPRRSSSRTQDPPLASDSCCSFCADAEAGYETLPFVPEYGPRRHEVHLMAWSWQSRAFISGDIRELQGGDSHFFFFFCQNPL